MCTCKLFVVLILITLSFSLANAQDAPETKLQFSLFSGYQTNDLNWSIAGNQNGQNPNILSELKWKNVGGIIAGGTIKYQVWKHIYATGTYEHTFTIVGTVNDMDYAADNRTNPIYAENFNSDKGFTNQWYLGAAYLLPINKTFTLMPGLGYGNSNQSLYIVDHSGSLPDLNSSYFTKWKGFYGDLSSTIKLKNRLNAIIAIQYDQLNYSAKGNWNLINEFQHPVSYRHTASGYGLHTSAKLSYKITSSFAIQAGGSFIYREVGKGIDLLYLTNNQVDQTQLNGLNNKVFAVNLGVTFCK